MKAIFLSMVLAAMSIGLFACGKDSTATNSPAETAGRSPSWSAVPEPSSAKSRDSLVGLARLKRVGRLVALRMQGPGFRLESLTKGKGSLSPSQLKDENGVPYTLEALTEGDAARRGIDFLLRGAGSDGKFGTTDDLEWTPEPRKVRSKILQSMEPEEEMPD